MHSSNRLRFNLKKQSNYCKMIHLNPFCILVVVYVIGFFLMVFLSPNSSSWKMLRAGNDAQR